MPKADRFLIGIALGPDGYVELSFAEGVFDEGARVLSALRGITLLQKFVTEVAAREPVPASVEPASPPETEEFTGLTLVEDPS